MKYSEETLKKMKNADLVNICKDLGIPYSNSKGTLNKAGLTNAILKAENKSVENNKSASDVKEIEVAPETTAANVKEPKEMAGGFINNDKLAYLNNLIVGTIVAVTLPNGKVISAKVTKKSTKRKKLMVVTTYGQEYLVDWSEVVWVKTGKRWPKSIYQMFSKGVNANGKEKEITE